MDENLVVEIHKRRNEMRFKQVVATALKVSNSVQLINIESTDESDASSSSILSENGSDADFPQEGLEALEIRGTTWPPSRGVDVRKAKGKPRNKQFSFSSKKVRQLEKDNKNEKSESKNSTPKEVSSVLPSSVRHFSYTGPPPRPSPWKEVYLTVMKPKEELADESVKKNASRIREKKEEINRLEQIRTLRKQLAKTMDSIKRKTSYIRRRNTPEENDDLSSGELSDGSSCTSKSSASASASSVTSNSCYLTSDDNSDDSSRGDHDSAVIGAHGHLILTVRRLVTGKKGLAKLRGFFRRERNVVLPM